MKKFIFLFISTFIFFSAAKAELVNNIVINGNDRVSKETIILLGDIERDIEKYEKKQKK